MKNDAILVKNHEWNQIRSDVSKVIEISLLSGSPDPAMSFGREIIRQGQLRGVALAQLFYEIDSIWEKFETDDRVEDAVERDMAGAKRLGADGD